MVVDSSALVAIWQREPDAPALSDAAAAATCVMASATLLEVLMVALSRRGEAGRDEMLGLIDLLEIEVLAVDRDLALAASEAFRRYGKGRHRASLNFGDCFAYALARHLRQPLLFKGDDFGHTDALPALTG
ncbi:MAG TPA: type II toxin-antitoxin system VapC family toxin [Geminicoccaceae bacterium]